MTLHLAFDLQGQYSRPKDEVPNIVSKLRRHACQNSLKRWLASLGSLSIHDLALMQSQGSIDLQDQIQYQWTIYRVES